MGVTYRPFLLGGIALAAWAIMYASFGAWVNVDFSGTVLCYIGPCNPPDVEGVQSHKVATFISDGHLTAVLGMVVLCLTAPALLFPAVRTHLIRVCAGAGLLAMAIGARVAFDIDTTKAGVGAASYDSATSGLYILIAAGALVAVLSATVLALDSANEEQMENHQW